MPQIGLTEAEEKVLYHLAKAWNAFLPLPGHHPDAITEFRHTLHQLQWIIAGRVAQRVNPEIWFVPPETKDS